MTRDIRDYEKLGAFYLGRGYDLDAGKINDDLLLYDSKDLTTHAVCVGMTGSGKTGLCISLLEEAAVDGIPALIVDMKGDLVNMLLTFPNLLPEDFLPWVDPGEATRKGMTREEYAANRAALWKKGLAKWDQDGTRIQRLRDAAEFAVYTPGSDAGRPLTILRSFAAPPPEVLNDGDAFRARVNGAVSGLLALMGIDADPVKSREYILLSNIFDRAWRAGLDLDLGALIQQIQSPPFQKVGFFDLDTFFAPSDRLGLAMSLNNLVASPGFSAWTKGDPLDIGKLLWTPSGKPRMCVLSIAHLSDAERMFFLTTLLNEVGSWMRTQPGTSSLRALLYIDEVFGYLPPTANPPTKIPMLTLLKQGRAFGLGCILATQNPVDLDYKALSNAGTWFLGRLQTERDKMRVLDGLEGASVSSGATFNRAKMEAALSGLDSRVFVMNNVHEDEPVVFHTRWAMSYLRGPMTRSQVRQVMSGLRLEPTPTSISHTPATAKIKKSEPAPLTQRPQLSAEIPVGYLEPQSGGKGLVWRPALFGKASIHFSAVREGVDIWRDLGVFVSISKTLSGDVWEGAKTLEAVNFDIEDAPAETGRFTELPTSAKKKKSYTSWTKALKNHLYREQSVPTYRCATLKERSKPGESEGEFRGRIQVVAREERDLKVEKLRRRYTGKLRTLEKRVQRAEQKVEREQSQYNQQKSSTAISFGATILGALFGRKVASRGNVGRAASTMKGVGRAARERGDIKRAEESLDALREDYAALEAQFTDDLGDLEADLEDRDLEISEKPIRLRKSDTEIQDLRLLWTPWIIDSNGIAEPDFDLD